MHPKDATSITEFATATAEALKGITEAHNRLFDRVDAIEKRITAAPDDEVTRLRDQNAALRSAAQVAADVIVKTPHTSTCTYRQQFAGTGYPCLCGKDTALSSIRALGITPTGGG
jgi:uncharacterized protein YdcH (DUF465 family)